MTDENSDLISGASKTVHLSGMYEDWFLDYASYVILERAVPGLDDGLKPVQRRILHAMKEMDDGRYNKVANIIGQTMKYHPHGDASIGDALVQLGQKDMLIDTQGNWGNVHTGDSAAAPRYIEARLSKFALEVVFNPKTTSWKLSYDGRNKEPLKLPLKFPLLLAQGAEGIAVGLASKILPHNFNELIDASIAVLQNRDFEIFPDFPTAGLADFSKYNRGLRGGKVRLRARISQLDRKTLAITEIPFGTNTSSLIDSIIAANDKGKIKIRKIDDNTAANVEILIHLPNGVSPDTTIDALYAFTNCEMSISPNACVIDNERPVFIGVDEMLRSSVSNTLELLKLELNIRRDELLEQLLFSSLEKIFIENRIYRDIEKCETWEAVLQAIDKGLSNFKDQFYREICKDDLIRLTEIKIKRISKYNSFKADEIIKNLNVELEEVENHLAHIVDFAIQYFIQIKKKFGKGRERKTEIRSFDTIEASMVAAANQKLYVNREEGFAGTALKKDEYVGECSDIDDIIVFRQDGTYVVTKVSDKVFVGKNVIHIDVFKRNDDRTIYNVVYQDGRAGYFMVKRFAVKSVTREKEYDLTKGTKNSRILYFTANPNGEAEIIKVHHRPKPRLKKLSFEFDFSEQAIKGRNAIGNILTRHAVRKIQKREDGVSTLGAIDLWYDESVRRLNTEERGVYLGAFKGDDKLLVIMDDGSYRTTGFDINTHFEDNMTHLQKFNEGQVASVVYYEGASQMPYLKRFCFEPASKPLSFIGDHKAARLVFVVFDKYPRLELSFEDNPKRKKAKDEILLHDFVGVKSIRARGKRLTDIPLDEIKLLDPLPDIDEEQDGVSVAEKDAAKDDQQAPDEDSNAISKPKPAPEENSDPKKSGADDSLPGSNTQMSLDF